MSEILTFFHYTKKYAYFFEVSVNKSINVLTEIGLSHNEAKVYYSMLSLGPTSVLKISQATDIKRSSVYPILNALTEKGLIHIQTRGVKQQYVAENPEKLETILFARQQSLQTVMHNLESLYANTKGNDSFVKHYQGLDIVKDLLKSLPTELKPGGFYYVISDDQQWQSLLPRDYNRITAYQEHAKDLNLDVKFLLQRTDYSQKFFSQKNNPANIRLLPDTYKVSTYMTVVPHRVVIVQTSSPYLAITIENINIIQMNKSVFELLWDSITCI